jgi:hypothetical protein
LSFLKNVNFTGFLTSRSVAATRKVSKLSELKSALRIPSGSESVILHQESGSGLDPNLYNFYQRFKEFFRKKVQYFIKLNDLLSKTVAVVENIFFSVAAK